MTTAASSETTVANNTIIIGFYTPNYKRLADTLAADCFAHGMPAKFYPVEPHEWANAILLKPTIIQRARAEFPEATLILMDVDCRLHGGLGGLGSLEGDISLHQRCKIAVGWRKNRVTIWPSTRIVVVRPTRGADRLIEAWRQECASKRVLDDEVMLSYAISQTPGVLISVLPPHYAAYEAGEAPDGAFVVHHSAHDAARKSVAFWRAIKRARRTLLSRILGSDYRARKYMTGPAS